MKDLIFSAKGGNNKADIVFKNANVVNVFSGKIEKYDVAVKNGIIIGTGIYSGENEIDCSEKYLMPSFTDSHVHIESSTVTPAEYAKAVIPKGVTCVVCDPHEIANVCGANGLEFMINSAKSVPLDTFFMLPSCVPATPFDSSGAVIDATDAKKLAEHFPEFKGLAEMMNVPGVLNADEEIIKKLDLFEFCDGHCPMLTGNMLNAYITAGIKSDHESVSAKEALEKISRGMYVHIREGTGAKNLKELIKAVTPFNMRRFTFCTDDKHADEILENGTIQNCIRLACENGLDPITAITIASLNPRECYGMKNTGAIAPGYTADIIISETLIPKKILEVYKNGKLIARNGEPLFEPEKTDISKVISTVKIAKTDEKDFDFIPNEKSTVIELHEDTLITTSTKYRKEDHLNLCAVIERHKATGRKGLAFIKGLGIKNGAIAQTIGHDSHNIVVVGDGSKNIKTAIDALGCSGGIVVVENGCVTAKLLLEIAGIMTSDTLENAAKNNERIINAAKKLNPDLTSSRLMILSFISLLVIPDVKLSDKGIFDVVNQKFIKT